MPAAGFTEFEERIEVKMKIRAAGPEDTKAMAMVNVETRKISYASFYPPELLTRRTPEQVECVWRKNIWEKPDPPGIFAFIAEEDWQGVVGFLIGGPEKSGDLEYLGEIYALYVLPQFQKAGVGGKLIQAAGKYFLENHMTSMFVWVLSDNPARFFYERLGGKAVKKKSELFGVYELEETGYGWRDITLLS